jgi:dihydrolipoamide dehydrogenase
MGDNADHASLCINAGCMPSKALFEPIDAMHHAQNNTAGWNVRPKQPDEYLAQVTRWKDVEIEKISRLSTGRSSGTGEQDLHDRSLQRCLCERSRSGEREANATLLTPRLSRTGSSTVFPNINGLDPTWNGVWTSDEILHNTRIPKSLAVIGVGAIGLEFSLRYARLGTAVTMLSRSGILTGVPAAVWRTDRLDFMRASRSAS